MAKEPHVALLTGVPGLDELLRGSLVLPPSKNGLIILIKGQPGSGKSTLALQIAGGALKWRHRVHGVRFYSYEQAYKDIKHKCKKLQVRCKEASQRGGGDPSQPSAAIHVFGREQASIEEEADTPIEGSSQPLRWALRMTDQLDRDSHRMRMIVVDGLNLLDQDERAKLELNRVVMRLRRLAVVGILVYEPSEPKYETVDFQADLVISLRGEEYTGTTKYYLHHLSIAKSRFQQTGLGWHQYKIRTSTGINVFPSLHFRVQKSSQDRDAEDELMTPFVTKGAHRDGRLDPRPVHTDDGSILTYLLKAENLRRGSCTVVLGPRRTWKTQLTLDFLRAGSRKKEPGLLLSLLDNQGTIMNQRGCLCGVDCVKNEPCSGNVNCYRNVYLKHLRPGCLAPSEFFHILEQILTSRSGDERIRRLVFWDLTQLEDRFPLLASEGMFVPALMDYLKNSRDPKDDDRPRQITSVFMGAPNTDLAKAASAMADNVVFCWRDTYYKDPTTKAEGIAFHVDRIEGQPGRQELFFLEQRDDKEAVPRLRQRPEPCPKEQLDYAESMIEAIRNLQSLPAQKRIVSARLTAAAAQEALGAAGPQRFSESSARTSSTIVGMTAAISGESSSP